MSLGFLVDAIFGGSAANAQAKAEKQAAAASQAATDKILAESQRQYDTTRADNMPWHDAGVSALGRISDPSNVLANFQASPDYNFRLNQGINSVTQNRAVSGLLRSGSALKGVNDYAQNTAANEFGNWWNRQSGLAGVGQAANAANQQAGQSQVTTNANALTNNANNLASSYRNRGDIWSTYAGQLNGSLNSNASAVSQFGGFGGG